MDNFTSRSRPFTNELLLQKFYVCVKCPSLKWIRTFSSWKKHYIQEHGSSEGVRPTVEMIDMDDIPIQLFECVDCGADASTKYNLLRHHRRSHPELSHDMDRHRVLKAGYKFVCLEAGCG
jgi:Zn ribbon nucleic-acid-binding protein